MSDFMDAIAQAINDAHLSLPTCDDCEWDLDSDPTNWDWNHHADAVLDMPQMLAIKAYILAVGADNEAYDQLLPDDVLAWVTT